MIVLGIVGAMGSGKTVVLEILGELGAAIIRADDLSRELLTPVSDTTQAVRVEFGEDFFDANGHLLRGKLAALIFSSEDARGRLNAIIYPAMLGLLRRQLEQICNRHCSPALMAVEAANLHEMDSTLR
jgi:dephospho-CoA kinase